MKKMTIDEVIFEYELMASDKCNGESRSMYKQIAGWLKELKALKEKA